MAAQDHPSIDSSGNMRGQTRKNWELSNDEKFFGLLSSSLFTPQRLDIFDSIKFYTCIIQTCKRLEYGDRLENISWRITNKALIAGRNSARSIQKRSKSIKRAGVRSIYFVVNPITNGIRRSPLVHGETKSEPDPHTPLAMFPSQQTRVENSATRRVLDGPYFQLRQRVLEGAVSPSRDALVSPFSAQRERRYQIQQQSLFHTASTHTAQDDSLFNRTMGTFNDPEMFHLSSDSDDWDSSSDSAYSSAEYDEREGMNDTKNNNSNTNNGDNGDESIVVRKDGKHDPSDVDYDDGGGGTERISAISDQHEDNVSGPFPPV